MLYIETKREKLDNINEPFAFCMFNYKIVGKQITVYMETQQPLRVNIKTTLKANFQFYFAFLR